MVNSNIAPLVHVTEKSIHQKLKIARINKNTFLKSNRFIIKKLRYRIQQLTHQDYKNIDNTMLSNGNKNLFILTHHSIMRNSYHTYLKRELNSSTVTTINSYPEYLSATGALRRLN